MRPEADSNLVATVQVPGYSSRAVPIDAGNIVRVTDVFGSQVADLFAIARDTSGEYLCTAAYWEASMSDC